MKQTAIIGGGLSGLATAYFLNQLNIPVKIYEKNQWGGSISHRLYQDTHLENDNDVFYLDNPLLPYLCHKLEIADKLVYIPKEKTRIYIVKELMPYKVPETKSEFWRSSLLFFVQKIKLMFAFKKKYSFWPNMSVHDAARNIFGESFAETFASAFTRLAFHNEAEDVEIASVFAEIYRQLPNGKGSLRDAVQSASQEKKMLWEQVVPSEIHEIFEAGYYKLTGGWQVLTEALKENILRNSVNQDPFLDDSAKELIRQERRVVVKSAKGKVQTFDGVVLTVSPLEISKLLKKFAPESAEEFASMKTASHSRVTCAWNKKDFHPAGYGICAPRKEKLAIHCESYLSNLCSERVPKELFVTRTIISGDNRLMDDSQLVAICKDFRKKVHGQNLHPQWYLVEHKEEQPLYVPGHQQKMQKLSQDLKALAPVYFCGRHYFSLNAAELTAAAFSIAREHAQSLI